MAGTPQLPVKTEPGPPSGSGEKDGGAVSRADIKLSLPRIKQECFEYSGKAVQETIPTEDCSRKVESLETMDGVARAPAVKPEPGSAAGSGDPLGGAGGGVPYTDIDISLPDIKQECLEYSRKAAQHSGSSLNEKAAPAIPGPPPRHRNSSAQTALSKGSTNRHALTTGIIFACIYCKFTSNVLQTVNSHELTHTTEKTFSCPQCSFTCKTHGYIKVHMLTHTREKLYSCTYCTYTCNFKRLLKVHKLTHTNKKLFSCAHCSYACNYKPLLTSHMLFHNGSKLFSCAHCSYTCNRKSTFTRHTRYCTPT